MPEAWRWALIGAGCWLALLTIAALVLIYLDRRT